MPIKWDKLRISASSCDGCPTTLPTKAIIQIGSQRLCAECLKQVVEELEWVDGGPTHSPIQL